MEAFDLSKNPYENFNGNFSSFHSFGPEYDAWIIEMMLDAILPNHVVSQGTAAAADIGAGSCYWPILFLKKNRDLRVTAVDPSEILVMQQSEALLQSAEDVADRLTRVCTTVQEYAATCSSPDVRQSLDCIYFMQSAHYIDEHDFTNLVKQLTRSLKPGRRKLVIQARNMTPNWHPWPFPHEWRTKVEEALVGTDMFYRADRYRTKLSKMSDVFKEVRNANYEFTVRIDAESYWERLESRWIPTFMGEKIIPAPLHRIGIDAMKNRFARNNEAQVVWTEKFVVVIAEMF